MDTKFTKTQDTVLNGIVRHILTAAGGALVARGSIAESELELAVGAIITLAGVIWSATAFTSPVPMPQIDYMQVHPFHKWTPRIT